MADLTLVVMEGGHPWGFRLEGGAEMREPIKINKVLEGGKAYHHGIEMGDTVRSINGEDATNMTISRARHLIRTSDDLLVLQVSKPSKDMRGIPEIRVIGPNENSGTSFHWGPNSVLVSQRNMTNSDRVRMRSTPSESSSYKLVSGVPPSTRTPLAMKNPQSYTDYQKLMAFSNPVPSILNAAPHSSRPAVRIPLGSAVVADGAVHRQSQPAWQNSRDFNTVQHNPNVLGSWTYGPNTNPNTMSSVQIRNTEPAPIKPGGLSRQPFTVRVGVTPSSTEEMDAKQFRQRTTDTGTLDKSLTSTAVVLPLSSTLRANISDKQLGKGKQHFTDNDYDLLQHQQEKTFSIQGQNRPSVHFQNSYNDRKIGIPMAIQHQRNWPQKIEDFDTGYHSVRDDPSSYADYDYLPTKPVLYQQTSGQQQTVLGDRTIRRDHPLGSNQTMFPDRQSYGMMTRQKLNEENLRRKLEIEKVIAEEKQRRYLKDQMANSARRHSDHLTLQQRSSILLDRYSDDEVAKTLARPTKRTYTKKKKVPTATLR